MSVIKKLLEKMRKTKDQRLQDPDGTPNVKLENLMRRSHKESLNESMHKIIKETTTGIAF